MKKTTLLLLSGILSVACSEKIETQVSIVPQPVSVTQFKGSAPLGTITKKTDSRLGDEEYVLKIKNGKVSVKGGSEAALFWADQTLKQITAQSGGEVPNLEIKDKPYFAYRGAHLDCCRHFLGVDDVKTFLDIMATHKLNTFHWHLTEDQGWRIEIKKYPKLTEIGSVRSETLIGHHRAKEHTFDGIPHGGFFTQDDCREIVRYAAERHITVIPEIEMPGHAVAALASYPELGCTGGPYEVRKVWGIAKDIFCVGKDETITFLKDVLDEVCEIFPSEYIHIGGDEAPRDRWRECPYCQKRIKDEGLKNEAELQSWLVREIEQYLAAKGRKIIGWDEILEGGVTQSATVMSWRGAKGGKAAAALGNDVIMCPNKHFYFDYYQTEGNMENGEPLSIGGHLNLEKTYSFDPFEDLDENAKTHIKGVQANMWTEYVSDMQGVEYRELPRLAAACEVAWNPEGRTAYPEFVKRVVTSLIPIWRGEGWEYADFAFRNPPIF